MKSHHLDPAHPPLPLRSCRPVRTLALLAALTLASGSSVWAQQPSCHEMPAAQPEQTAADQASTGHDPHAHHAAGHPPAMAAETTAEARGMGETHGLDLPNVELVDQDGKPVQLYDDLIADRVVAMNFIFTTCTTICPPMGASFGRLQKELGDLLGSKIGLVSVSIDPTTDTPPRLKSWGEKFGAGKEWSLLTGAKQDVDQVLRALEVFTPTPEDHGPIVLLGNDRTHQWVRVNGLTPPAKLAEMLKDLLATDRPTHERESR